MKMVYGKNRDKTQNLMILTNIYLIISTKWILLLAHRLCHYHITKANKTYSRLKTDKTIPSMSKQTDLVKKTTANHLPQIIPG